MSDTEKYESTVDLDIGLLIKLIQNCPYIYNNQLPEFKNISLKERTWNKIAATLKVPVDDCMRVWRNLRDKYGKEKRFCLDHPESRSKWEFYDLMHFLKPFVKRRKRTRRIQHRNNHKIEFIEETTEDASNSFYSNNKMWDSPETKLFQEEMILENEFDENEDTEEITLETEVGDDFSVRGVTEPEDTINILRHQSSEEAFGAYVASRLLDFPMDDRQTKKVKIFKILEDLD